MEKASSQLVGSNKYKFLLLGIAFGLSFPVIGTLLVCMEDGCPEGVLSLHLKERLMQIIDLAPFVLGTFSYLLGLNVDRRLIMERNAQEALSLKAKLQKELAEQLQAQNAELRELNATLDGLVYTASHDLKTPLVNFKSMLAMLRMVRQLPDAKDKEEEVLVRLEDAVGRFDLIISDLLQISKVERAQDLPSQVIPLKEPLAVVKAALEADLRQQEARIEMNVGELAVLGDTESISSVFYNLLSNAIKYRNPNTEPVIKVLAVAEKGRVEVRVTDNGQGIDMEKHRGKLFKMFVRLNDRSQGSGIGLYIVRRTMEKLGGSVQLESELGKGSTFILNFAQG